MLPKWCRLKHQKSVHACIHMHFSWPILFFINHRAINNTSLIITFLIWPNHCKTNNVACADRENEDYTVCLSGPISVFIVCFIVSGQIFFLISAQEQCCGSWFKELANPGPAESRYAFLLQTVQTQISWLLKKPTDLDLHCLSLSIWICINNLDQVIWLAEN